MSHVTPKKAPKWPVSILGVKAQGHIVILFLTYNCLFIFPAPANKTINETNVCYFALNSDVMDAKTIKAEFGVFLKRSRAPTARPTLLIISKLEKRQVGIIKKTVQTRQLTLDTESTGRWYRFSTDRIVKDWVQNPNKNLGLQVEAYDYDGTQLAIVQTDNEREEPYVGFYVCKFFYYYY